MEKVHSKDANFVYEKILSMDNFPGSDSECDFFINNIKNRTPFAFSRFNDGEMMGICMDVGVKIARGDQAVSLSLKEALTESMSYQQENYYVGITCPHCQPLLFHNAGLQLTNNNPYVVRAVATTNRNWAKVISKISEACKGKKIRFISGDDQDMSFLVNVMNLEIIDHVKLPRKETWNNLCEIEDYVDNVKNEELVFLSIGPTARVLAQRWFAIKPQSSFLDVGSNFDPFTRNVWHKCHLGWENGFNIQNTCVGCN